MQSGDRFADHVILALLGQGAHGSVYRARDSTGREVALKVLKDDVAGDVELSRRFQREAQIAQAMTHPHVVRCFAAGEVQHRLWMTSELVTGGSLDDVRSQHGGRLPLDLALRHGADLFAGLEAIYRAGLIHRDIKPANVLADAAGRGKVADLGLARSTSSDRAKFTADGMIIGSPAYIAPEGVRGESDLDIRLDLYSAGVTLFQLLTGDLPFVGNGVLDVLRKQISEPAPRLRERLPGCPEALDRLINDLLAKDRKHRPKTPADAAKRLGEIIAAAAQQTLVNQQAMATVAMVLDPSFYPGTLAPSAPIVFPGTLAPAAPSVHPATLAPSGPIVFPGTLAPSGPIVFPGTLAPPPKHAPTPAPVVSIGSMKTLPADLGQGTLSGADQTLDAAPAPAAARCRLEGTPGPRALRIQSATGQTLFVYAGAALQLGRDGIDHGSGNDVCLRLFPAAARADDSRKISATHLRLAITQMGATITDLSSSQGTTLNGVQLGAATSVALLGLSQVSVAGVLGLSVQTAPPGPRVTGGVPLPALLVRRTNNAPEHAYLLLPDSVTLGLDLLVGSGPLTLAAVAGSLWWRDGEVLRALVPGATLPLPMTIHSLDPRDQKG